MSHICIFYFIVKQLLLFLSCCIDSELTFYLRYSSELVDVKWKSMLLGMQMELFGIFTINIYIFKTSY